MKSADLQASVIKDLLFVHGGGPPVNSPAQQTLTSPPPSSTASSLFSVSRRSSRVWKYIFKKLISFEIRVTGRFPKSRAKKTEHLKSE
ncbi:hypothetical protein Sjap_015990 [Stephania japonica]|uniref:Uncharacterized protein n=1 Tax=Stephania japonica TaxID=461633 RepID=A0AAP0IKA2_9MAGN